MSPYCPKCKEYIIQVSRSLIEVHGVDSVGEVDMSNSYWEYSKFKHQCGHVFESEELGSMINLVGVGDA